MIPPEQGVVRPIRNDRTPVLGSLAIMVATQVDFEDLRRRMDLPDQRALFLSRLCYCAADQDKPVLVGPLMGAPYAVMLMETLRVWGVKRLLFYGWCGSISHHIRTGDIILPDGAIIDEGTSLHYHQQPGATVHLQGVLRSALAGAFDRNAVDYTIGRAWSTDGIFRETPTRIRTFQSKGAVAVEMELSALISAALLYAVSLAAVLVVSDELSDLKWRPGFNRSDFKKSRRLVCDLLAQINGKSFHG